MDIVTGMKAFNDAANDIYLRSLIYPESYIGKIPGPLPISSTTAALRDNFSITPNATGKFLLIIDPFYNKAQIYQNDDLDGTGNGTVTERTMDQNNTIVDQFRLVSSCVILRYYGNFNEMSGIFVAATASNVRAGKANPSTGFTDYLNFNNIEDLPNKYVSKCVDGIKMVYAPMDNRAIEFRVSTDYSDGNHPCRWQYLFICYGDLFPNTTCIRVDYYRNIEYTSTPLYKEYILQTRSLPAQYTLPIMSSLIGNAPVSSSVSVVNDNNRPYELKIYESARRNGQVTNPLFMLS